MIILRHVKFISDGRVFRAGDIVPDNSVTRSLIEKGFAEIVNNNVKTSAKKPKAEAPRENDEINT